MLKTDPNCDELANPKPEQAVKPCWWSLTTKVVKRKTTANLCLCCPVEGCSVRRLSEDEEGGTVGNYLLLLLLFGVFTLAETLRAM